MGPLHLLLITLVLLSTIEITVSSHPEDWRFVELAKPEETLTFHVLLKQRNIPQLEATVLSVSDPKSPQYGQYLTKEQILDLIAPPIEDHDAIQSFLESNGFEVISYRDSFKVKGTVASLSQIFSCQFSRFKHSPTGTLAIRQSSGRMILPQIFDGKVDMITGLTGFPIIPDKFAKYRTKPVADPTYEYVIPQVIRRIYNIPANAQVTNPKTTQTVIEFLPVTAPILSDGFTFAKLANEDFSNYTTIVGPYTPSQSANTESTLDVEYLQGLGKKANNWYWTIADGWALEMALQLFNHPNPPLVVSVSYGWPELLTCESSVTNAKCVNSDAKDYVTRANVELAKLGGLGLSVLIATQDEGAPSEANLYCSNTAHPVYAIYPSSSPWVTAVSGTTVVPSTGSSEKRSTEAFPPICNDYPCATSNTELPCQSNNTYFQWTTGGGFSEYAARPSYQDKAVAKYLATPGILKPPVGLYPASNRGYADVSATGSRILIVKSGDVTVSAGTSASTPIFAGVVSLLNDARLNAGKKPLGFLNPLIYQILDESPSAFNDIYQGDNRCTLGFCCTYGYGATRGWDPVTGVGTPNFGEILKYINTRLP